MLCMRNNYLFFGGWGQGIVSVINFNTFEMLAREVDSMISTYEIYKVPKYDILNLEDYGLKEN
jgi:hypothetical protein